MKKAYIQDPARQYGRYALAVLLLLLKTYIFYSQLHLGGFEPVFCLITMGITALVCGLLRLISPGAARIGFVVLYSIAGVFMAADSIYYSYVAKMPSVAQIGMVGQLVDIKDTILNLLNWKHLFMLIDFPLWFLYFLNRKPVRDTADIPCRRREVHTLLSGSLICALAVTGCGLFGQFRVEYIRNELFCYHAADFTKAALQSAGDTPVDKSLYTLKDDTGSAYFGVAEGRNVFILQIEALQNFVIGAWYEGQELTPNLNRLLGMDTLYFPNYYYQIGGGNTADAEFAVNNSLFPPENQAAYVQYPENHYYGLPFLLKDNGYSGAHVFHNYKGDFWNRRSAYPAQGFDSYTALEDFEEIDPFPMGISDRQMFTQSMEYLKTWEEPFYAFYITVSSHHPYALPLKDRHITLKPEDEATLFGLYIQSMNYVDRVLGEWLDMLKEEGLYDNSVFILYGDHYALTNTDPLISSQVGSMLKRDYTIFDVFNVPLVIHIPGSGRTETITTAGGHMDVLPTLLCLLGIDEVKTVLFGQNLLTAESGFVCEQTHMSIGSFIDDNVFFKKPHNNILSNYSVYERDTMTVLSPDTFHDLSDAAAKRISDCMVLMAQNDL
ncbi:MAG: LTA synthase family protein, partial [Clostridia bacterium]|nr:LTA synthase family protein [Clostridia bacterium]